MEQRFFDLRNIEIRRDTKTPTIFGHAAVFNTITDIGGVFREQIAPGAFRNTIRTSDVKALLNHDPNYVLGRNKSGTLKMQEDDKGLAVEISVPDTQLIRDMVLTPMERGDLNQMSFAFQIKKEEWAEEKGKTPLRTIKEVDPLFDVSVVTQPAYPTTDANVRAILQSLKGKSNWRLNILRKKLELLEKTF